MLKRFIQASVAVAFCMSWGIEAVPRAYTLPEETATFLAGPDAGTAAVYCTVCHSADYIGMQPPHQGKAFWTAEVTKMRKVFGAPVDDEDAAKIIDYLAATY